MMHLSLFRSTILIACSIYPHLSFADVLIVKNRANTELKLNKDEVRSLYLGTPTFSEGHPIKPIDQAVGSAARTTFVRKLLNTTEDYLNNQWLIKIFSGKGEPPEVFSSDAEVLQQVKQNKYAVGYVQEASMDNNVDILYRIET